MLLGRCLWTTYHCIAGGTIEHLFRSLGKQIFRPGINMCGYKAVYITVYTRGVYKTLALLKPLALFFLFKVEIPSHFYSHT